MTRTADPYDLLVIGSGAAGLSVAACSQLPKPSIPLLKKDTGESSAPNIRLYRVC